MNEQNRELSLQMDQAFEQNSQVSERVDYLSSYVDRRIDKLIDGYLLVKETEKAEKESKKIIKGYNNSKELAVKGLHSNNLRYFKSEFASRNQTLQNKKELTRLATELLCIKENCYTERTTNYIVKNSWISIFTNPKSQFIVIYDDLMIEDSIPVIKKMVAEKNNDSTIKVYVFSNGQYPYTEDFEEVLDCITLCALPDAIYKAYQNVLPKKKRDIIPVLDDDNTDEVSNF
jgi:adenine-specific DNA-methyltransferase